MKRSLKKLMAGFTLVELMIVVVILGILAAVAIPAFSRYIKRSKTTEVAGNIAKIYQGEVTYYSASAERGDGTARFVNAGALPSTPSPGQNKFPADAQLWAGNTDWSAIGFGLDGAHYYRYTAISSTTTLGFTAQAEGDIDGDGTLSVFQRQGTVANGEIQGTNMSVTSELE